MKEHRLEILIAAMLLACLGSFYRAATSVSDRPPCEISIETGHCGCTATSCDMPCTGCCPGGCKLPPSPTGR